MDNHLLSDRSPDPSELANKEEQPVSTDFFCTFCKGSSSSPLYPTSDIFGFDYHIHRCNACQAIVLHPPPSEEMMMSIPYDETYYGEGEKKFSPLIERVLDYFRNSRARLLNRHLNGSGRILDIGCGNGIFLDSMARIGEYEIFGIELDGESARRAAQVPKINLQIGPLSWDDFPENHFDAITLFHVFEHLSEPRETLKIMERILKKDGTLIMSFPNIDSFQSRWFKGNWFHLDPPRHLFFFTPKDFKREMDRLGFEVIKEKHFNVEYNPYGMQQSLLNYVIPKRDVLYEHLKGNRSYTKGISGWSLWWQSAFFKATYPIFTGLDLSNLLFRKGATIEFVLKRKR